MENKEGVDCEKTITNNKLAKKNKDLHKEAKSRLQQSKLLLKNQERAIKENWYKLDNSALIYPAIDSSEWNSVYRISVDTTELIKPEILQKALDDTIARYPFYNVSLQDGLFWHYFQPLTTKPQIEKERFYPCRPFVFTRNTPIFRVLYFNKKISYESFHSLADGGGATKFFNTLLVRYFELLGTKFNDLQGTGLNYRDKTFPEENEDSFRRYATGEKGRSRKETPGYQIKGLTDSVEVLRVITGIVKVAQLKEIAKKYSATINELLSGIYMKVLIEDKKLSGKQKNKPIKLSIPVNLRKMFPSQTMRNFSQTINIEIPLDKENASLEELIAIVIEQMKNLTPEFIMGNINANINSEKNFLVRILPLGLKDVILGLIYNQVGEKLFTSTISNLGLVKLPPELDDKIINYSATLGSTKFNKLNMAVMSYKNNCSLTFTTRLQDLTIIKKFFTLLASLGFEITMESNI